MKKIISFLLTFLVVAIILTSGLIYVENNTSINIGGLIKKSGNEDIVRERTIDLLGMYNQNDLIINEVKKDYNGYEILVPVIEGLKDKEVENKVNSDIEKRLFDGLAKLNITSQEDVPFISVAGNFSNILSINVFTGAGNFENFNYELVNGNRLTLEDLFTKNTVILDVVRNAFYERLITGEYYDEELQKFVSTYDENEYYEVVNKFMNTDRSDFIIFPDSLSIRSDDVYACINFVDYADSMVVYNKYVTRESIFERDDIGLKNIVTCSDISTYVREITDAFEFGYTLDNLWTDYVAWYSFENQFEGQEERLNKVKKYAQKIDNETRELIEKYKKIASDNPDKFYIVRLRPDVSPDIESNYNASILRWEYEYTDTLTTSIYYTVYEMPREVYDSTMKMALYDAYRYEFLLMHGGVEIPKEVDGKSLAEIGVTEEEFYIYKAYNYMTDEDLTYYRYSPEFGEYDTESFKTGTTPQNLITEFTNWTIIYEDDKEIWITTTKTVNLGVNFQGAKGYLNCACELDNICEALYSNDEIGATARSLKLQDIQIILGVEGDKSSNAYAYYPAGSSVSGEVEHNGKIYKAVSCPSDNIKIYAYDDGGIESVSTEGFKYTVPGENNPVYVSDTSLNFDDSFNQKLKETFGKDTFYLASTCTIPNEDGTYTCVYSANDQGIQIKNLYHFGSSGNLTSLGIRPLVIISK